MVDNDWMDAVINGDDDPTLGEQDLGGMFSPRTIRTVIEELENDDSISPDERAARINNALSEEASQIRCEKILAATEIDALRQHVDSPSTLRGEGLHTADELLSMANEKESDQLRNFDHRRLVLVDVAKMIYETGDVKLFPETWGELSSLDDDGYVTQEFAAHGSLLDLSQDAVFYHGPRGIDYSRSVHSDWDVDQSYTLGHSVPEPLSVEFDPHPESSVVVDEVSFDESTLAHIERHRREASTRQSREPTLIGDLASDFFRKHGRDLDGKPLPGIRSGEESGLEL